MPSIGTSTTCGLSVAPFIVHTNLQASSVKGSYARGLECYTTVIRAKGGKHGG
jgi:hypothetical protein